MKAIRTEWFSCHSDDDTCYLIGNINMFEFNTNPSANFVVYRRKGPGNVVVGDVIALHFPKESGKWFSMLGCKGHLSACPGAPSTDNGMSTEDSWDDCNGEVFRIYARNRKLGEAIVANDNIKLYYLRQSTMVNIMGIASCDDTDKPTLPPANNDYSYKDTLMLYIA